MGLNPRVRTLLWSCAAVAAGAWCAFRIADESYAVPALIGAALAALVVARYTKSLSAILLAGLIVGNIVGNRGFAQLFISSSLPILPAELVLATTGIILLFRTAVERRSPVQKGKVELALMVWIVASAIRVPYDIKTFGFLAVRDFATVYYAAFFFVAADVIRSTPSARPLLRQSLLWGCFVLVLIFPAYDAFPDFFLGTLLFRGDPLIFYKGDLAGLFLAIGSTVFFFKFESTGKYRWAALSLIAAGEVAMTTNRASALALLFAAVALALRGRFKFMLSLAAAGALGALAIVAVASIKQKPLTSTPLYSAYDEFASLWDPAGSHTYSGDETSMKGDNNAFRLTWWKITINQTLHDNPWFGLGWGYDLATHFEQVYYPEGSEEFSARSPHSLLITVFARGGLVSLASFLALLAAMGFSTFRTFRDFNERFQYWLICWMIFIAACLGVVLEGPMGAVVFWCVMAMANTPEPAIEAEITDSTSHSTEIEPAGA